jgi:hypothetical protein
VAYVLVAGAFDRGALDIDALTEHFGAFCDDAGARDIRVEWKPFRMGASPSCRWPGKSYAVQADPTAGWSSPPGTCRRVRPTSSETWKLLESIPTDRPANLQVADALLAPQADSLYAERRSAAFPVTASRQSSRWCTYLLDSKAGLRGIGSEIVGHALDGLTPAEVGRRSALAVRAVLHGRGRLDEDDAQRRCRNSNLLLRLTFHQLTGTAATSASQPSPHLGATSPLAPCPTTITGSTAGTQPASNT